MTTIPNITSNITAVNLAVPVQHTVYNASQVSVNGHDKLLQLFSTVNACSYCRCIGKA